MACGVGPATHGLWIFLVTLLSCIKSVSLSYSTVGLSAAGTILFSLHPSYLSITFLIESKFLKLEDRAPKILFLILFSLSFPQSIVNSIITKMFTVSSDTLLFIPRHTWCFCCLQCQIHQTNVKVSFKPELKYLLVFELIPNSHFSTSKMSHSISLYIVHGCIIISITVGYS